MLGTKQRATPLVDVALFYCVACPERWNQIAFGRSSGTGGSDAVHTGKEVVLQIQLSDLTKLVGTYPIYTRRQKPTMD